MIDQALEQMQGFGDDGGRNRSGMTRRMLLWSMGIVLGGVLIVILGRLLLVWLLVKNVPEITEKVPEWIILKACPPGSVCDPNPDTRKQPGQPQSEEDEGRMEWFDERGQCHAVDRHGQPVPCKTTPQVAPGS